MRFPYFVPFILSSALSGAAQDASLALPALGFAFDASSQAIRPIRGIPGAALIGSPADAGSPVSKAAISPRQDYALVLAGNSPLRVLPLNSGTVAPRPLDDALASPDRIVFSPTGRSVLLYLDSGRLQTITGLPDSPGVREWNLPAAGATTMAVSDDGALVVLSRGGQDSDPVWLLTSDGGCSQLPLAGSVAAASFRRNSHDVIAASSNGDLYLVRDPEGSPGIRTIPFSGKAASPAAVRFSADGSRVYTADAGGTISITDVATGSVASVSCGCQVESLEPLNSPDLFRLTSVSSQPLMLFDGSGPDPRVWFVPPAIPSGSEGGRQ